MNVHAVQHASDGHLELAVLGSVDERVDQHQYHGEVVEPADERDNLVEGL